MHRPSGSGTGRDEEGAGPGAVLRGPRLVVCRREPGSMRVAADLRGRFDRLGPVTMAPLARGALDRDLSRLCAVAVVLPVGVPSSRLLDALDAAVAVVGRAAREMGSASGDGEGPRGGDPEQGRVVVAGPDALLRHRRVRPLLARPGVAWWRTDGNADHGADDSGGPDPVQALADRLAACGVADLETLTAVRDVLESRRDEWESGDLPDRDVVDEIRAAAPGLRRVDDLRGFDLAVRVVDMSTRLDGRPGWPGRIGDDGWGRPR